VRPEAGGSRRRVGAGWRHGLLYPAVALGATALSLLLLQMLVGRRRAEQQLQQLVPQVTANLVLAEVALERFSPPALAQLSGLRLAVGPRPEAGSIAVAAGSLDPRLRLQARLLRSELCRHLPRCPAVWPGSRPATRRRASAQPGAPPAASSASSCAATRARARALPPCTAPTSAWPPCWAPRRRTCTRTGIFGQADEADRCSAYSCPGRNSA
jgi:hypothetical protein